MAFTARPSQWVRVQQFGVRKQNIGSGLNDCTPEAFYLHFPVIGSIGIAHYQLCGVRKASLDDQNESSLDSFNSVCSVVWLQLQEEKPAVWNSLQPDVRKPTGVVIAVFIVALPTDSQRSRRPTFFLFTWSICGKDFKSWPIAAGHEPSCWLGNSHCFQKLCRILTFSFPANQQCSANRRARCCLLFFFKVTPD